MVTYKKFYELHDKYINLCSYDRLLKELHNYVVEETMIKPKDTSAEDRLEQMVKDCDPRN